MMITLGALAPSLREQIAFPLPADVGAKIDRLQLDSEAITRLSLRGLLSDSQTLTARKKLVKRIEATLSAPAPGTPERRPEPREVGA
jgi:hypothetical protein